jgi:hypothetical protein
MQGTQGRRDGGGGDVVSTESMVAITVGLVMLALLGIGAARVRRSGWQGIPVALRRPPEEVRRARRDRRRAARAARRARRSRRRELGAADRAVAAAERARAEQLAQLQGRIATLEDRRGKRVADFGGCFLHEFVLLTPGGEVPLDAVEASVDTAGNLSVTKRATLTRMATGGLLLGGLGAVLSLGFQKKEQQDTRELYLLLDAGPASVVIQADPDAGAEVRRFASAVNAFVSDVAARRQRRAQELATTRAERVRVEADRSAIEAARLQRDAIRGGSETSAALTEAESELMRAREAERLALSRWHETAGKG